MHATLMAKSAIHTEQARRLHREGGRGSLARGEAGVWRGRLEPQEEHA